ncbi:serine hydrolase [Frankia sp. AiPa1]|uniref:serine hydrolase n=1 Tax=Frankia sp. AiPa1 TaxID=573492 RepID=UPI00202B9829|nr:serine hydrolase [Frankia sp. AiPa1]MCL9758292.1 class A beta-lactamase-related serine hydrolase [Frankia sp. AiPa1]
MAASVCGGLLIWPTDGLGSGGVRPADKAAVAAAATVAATGGSVTGVTPALPRAALEPSPPASRVDAARGSGRMRTIVDIAATGASSNGLADRLRAHLAARPGHVSVAMYDVVSGETVAVTDPAVAGYEMASTVKLDILTALVRSAGPSGTLTARQRALAQKMISVSDNGAATVLWTDAGGTSGMNAFFALLGMRATQAGPGDYWGLTRTTGADQLAVLRAIAYPGLLTAAQRSVIAGFLGTVIPAQRWGLTGGVPSGVTVELKNGWLPRTSGWVIASLAHVHGAGRDYVMAVFSKNGPSMASGVTTVQGVSALAWDAATAPSAATASSAASR